MTFSETAFIIEIINDLIKQFSRVYHSLASSEPLSFWLATLDRQLKGFLLI